MIYQEFYAELGKLLYAVADIDGAISEKEKNALHDIVKQELVPSEKSKDEFGTDAAFYTEFEFDFLEEEIADAQPAFESFIDFVEDHHTAFDQRLKNVCLHVTSELALAYHKRSKKEMVLLEKLKNKLEKIEIRNGNSKRTR